MSWGMVRYYSPGVWGSRKENGDVQPISTNSILDLTETEQPGGVEDGGFFVQHESQQEKKLDAQNDQNDRQTNRKPPSEHDNLQGTMTQALPSLGQKEPGKQPLAPIPPEQRDAQSQRTGGLHPVREYSSSEMTEAVSSPQQKEAQERATLADEESTGESAPGSGLLPNTLSEDASSISSRPQETSATIPAETTSASIPPETISASIPPETISASIPPETTSASTPAEITNASIPPETTSASIPAEITNASIPPETTSDHSFDIPRNDRSSAAFARAQLAVRGICEKREALLGMRVKVQEDRKSIGHKRSALGELNALILQHIQKTAALEFPTSPVPPRELLVELQDLLEDLQVSGAEFDATEEALNRKEWELKEAEKEVYQSRFFEEANSPAWASAAFVEEDVTAASDSTAGVEVGPPSLEKQYLSRKGDAQMLNEELHELRAERAYLVEEDRSRQAIGRSLDPESRKFLDEFDVRHKQLQQDLFYVQEDMFRLQNAISNQSDILYTASHFDLVQSDDVPLTIDVPSGEDLPPSNDAFGSVLAPVGDEAPLLDHKTTSHSLLLPPDASSPSFSTVSLDSDERRLSPVGYINEWLLHRLRRSPLEILRFKTYLRDIHIDADQLKSLVLEWWPNDEMLTIYSNARRRLNLSFNAWSGQTNMSTQTRRSDSAIFNHRRLAQRSRRDGQLTLRDRCSASLDCLVNNLTLHRPSTAASL